MCSALETQESGYILKMLEWQENRVCLRSRRRLPKLDLEGFVSLGVIALSSDD